MYATVFEDSSMTGSRKRGTIKSKVRENTEKERERDAGAKQRSETEMKGC